MAILEAKQFLKSQRPRLFDIVEKTKIRDFNEQERTQHNESLITYLMSIMGVTITENDPRNAHYIAIDEFVSANLNHLAYAEIKEGFMMMLRGEFDDYPEFRDNKLFNKLDCVLVSKVVKCYERRKHEIIDPYRDNLKRKIKEIEQAKNKPSDEQIKTIMIGGLERIFEEYKSTKKFSEILKGQFDYLTKKTKVVVKSKAEWLDLYEKGKVEVKIEKTRKSGVADAVRSLKSKFKEAVQGYDAEVLHWVYEYTISELFDNLIKENKQIKDLF